MNRFVSQLEVDKDKDGYHYNSVQAALDVVEKGDTIYIDAGIYEEKVVVRTSGITIIGDGMTSSTIQYADHGNKPHKDGGSYGTFRSYTFLVIADDVTIKHLTIRNNAGDGRMVGQAIAMYAEGDQLSFSRCRFIGHQDTLFAGPLPESPIIPGSFIGPSELRPYKRSRHYYVGCELVGDVDYVFGSALAVFKDCRLMTRNRQEAVNGFVTAPSTWSCEPYGFVFIACEFLGEPGITPGSVYLGRPWRPCAQVMMVACSYDDSIHPDHWDPWGKKKNKLTTRFSEYACLDKSNPNETKHHMEGEDPFITIGKTQPSMDFLDEWHKSMLLRDL